MAEMTSFHVPVPISVSPGQIFIARIPSGQLMQVTCPPNTLPGTLLVVNLETCKTAPAAANPLVPAPGPAASKSPVPARSEQRHKGAGEHPPAHTRCDEPAATHGALAINKRGAAKGTSSARGTSSLCASSDQSAESTLCISEDQNDVVLIKKETSSGLEGGSRRSSGRARNSISYDENKWRITHGTAAGNITVENSVDGFPRASSRQAGCQNTRTLPLQVEQVEQQQDKDAHASPQNTADVAASALSPQVGSVSAAAPTGSNGASIRSAGHSVQQQQAAKMEHDGHYPQYLPTHQDEVCGVYVCVCMRA